MKMFNTTETQTMLNELLSIPNDISEIQKKLIGKTLALEEINEAISNMEGSIKYDISTEVDESGKKKFSNQDLRDAEFNSRVENHTELNEFYENKKDIQYEINDLKIKFEYLSNRQRNLRTIINFLSNIEQE